MPAKWITWSATYPSKKTQGLLMAQAKSAIVIAFDYVQHPKPVAANFPLQEAKMARYAQGEDYHYWLKEKLEVLIAKLRVEFPDVGFACYTDSSPVLERDLAYRAGLGWVGKNTCVIHPKHGSLFLLGEIFTTLDLPDRCDCRSSGT
jgi:epoxyqueuosine reductase